MLGLRQRLGMESVYTRPVGPCALGHTCSIVLGQQDPTVHRISIFPPQAAVWFTPKFPVRAGNFGVVAEYSIDFSFAVRSFLLAAYPKVRG